MNKLLTCFLIFFGLTAAAVSIPSVAGTDNETRRPVRTERTAAMRQPVYAKLSKVRELADKKEFAAASEALKSLQQQKGLNGYEAGMTWNLAAYLAYTQGDYAGAIEAYREVLAQEGIPQSLETQTLYSMAQMYFVTEQYEQALQPLNEWFAVNDEPGPSAWIMLAQAHYQLQDYAAARKAVDQAINTAQSQQREVNESWYLLARAIHYSNKDYPRLLGVLKHLAAAYPKREYWVQLAAVYGELGNSNRQLAVLETAYEQDLLSKESDLLSLAQLLLANDVPYKAGEILARGMTNNLIEKDTRNLRLLADAWLMAKEYDKGVAVLQQAAASSDDGELHLRLAHTWLEMTQYENAAESARTALQKGGLDKPGNAHVVAGLAAFQLKQFDTAIAEFRKARDFEESAKLAEQWLPYIEKERNRRAELAAQEAVQSGETTAISAG